jgi:hypothetical protein
MLSNLSRPRIACGRRADLDASAAGLAFSKGNPIAWLPRKSRNYPSIDCTLKPQEAN